MCLKDASVPNISAISEKSDFLHIFAYINRLDNVLMLNKKNITVIFKISDMYEACDSVHISAIIGVYNLITAHTIHLYLMYF